MKKISILIIGVLLTCNLIVAQPSLNWRIINPRIEQILHSTGVYKNYLCWDVQVSATAGGTYFDGMQVVFTFNTAGLDATTLQNRKVTKGPLASGDDGSGELKYSVSNNWNVAQSKLFIGILSNPLFFGEAGGPVYFNEVTTTFQTLVTVKVSIADRNLVANLIFVEASMDGVSTYRNEFASPVYYSDPYSYGTHDLANAYLGRIYSTNAGGQWSQAKATVSGAGTGFVDWNISENTTVWDGNGHITTTGALVTGLYVDPGAILTVDPAKSLTASGDTYISDASGLVIASTIAGTGSFKDNGTINYFTGGSADVQTYLKNTSSPGFYYAHLVGPTVSDPVFQTTFGYPGVYLQEFNLGVSTYAYEYSEPINNWVNIFANLEDVRSTKGILMSTVDQTDHTLTMTGHLVTGAISSAPLSYTTSQLELLSNPYASSLDFLLLYGANSASISNKYQLYNPGTGTYDFYTTAGGGSLTKDIQVGQGFFVETLNTSTVSFNNTMRSHSTAPFLKDGYANQLRLNLAGNGYANSSFIYFKPEGTLGYDKLNDIYKWFSILPEASEIWTVANDQSLLCFNSLPSLGGEMVSVPLGFKSSTDAVHTITAENIISFDAGTEIYLEDLATGAEWHNLVINPVYEFTGTPDGDQNRFIVHFFGPTGITDPDDSGLIDIYAWGQDAYIVNRGNETVKEYVAYDMMGRELHRGTLPNNTVNKVTIGDVSAYYIIKVITKEGRIYNNKVYITN